MPTHGSISDPASPTVEPRLGCVCRDTVFHNVSNNKRLPNIEESPHHDIFPLCLALITMQDRK